MKILVFLLCTLSAWASLAQEVPFIPQQIKKVYYLLASAKGSGRSAFGHGYLRLGVSERPSANDFVVEFVADVAEEELNYLRAIGIGERYRRAVVVKRYREILPEMTQLADRDLTSFELRLTDEARESFVQQLNHYVAAGEMYHYSFFKNNCSEAVARLLRTAGVKLSYRQGIIPTALPKALERQQLILSQTLDLSISNRRSALFERYQSELAPRLRELGVPADWAFAPELSLRLTAFSKLSALPRTPLLEAYLTAFVFLEKKMTRQVLIDQLHRGTALQGQRLVAARSRLFIPHEVTRPKVTVAKSEFLVDKNELFLEYLIEVEDAIAGGARSGAEREFRRVRLTGSELSEGKVYLDGRLIGFQAPRSVNAKGIIATHAWISDASEFNQRTYELELRTIIVTQEAPAGQRERFTRSDENALKNDTPAMPMCAGLVDLQKFLLERVVFAPELPALSAAENLLLLNQLLHGKVIVVPGMSSIAQFTRALPAEDFAALVYQFHLDRYRGFGAALSQYFKQKFVTEETVRLIGALGEAGISTAIYFKTPSGVAHAVLVTGVRREADGGYLLEAYDPNVSQGLSLGFTRDVFRFDPRSERLVSFLYGTQKAYVLRPQLEQELYLKEVAARPDARGYLVQNAKKFSKYHFSLSEIINGL